MDTPAPARSETRRAAEPRVRSLKFPISDWAENNRIVCDFFHRGIVRPLLPRQKIREWEVTDWKPAPPQVARAS